MTTFNIHTTETAPEARELLSNAQSAYGFVPNLMGMMAEAPALIEGYVALMAIFDKADLTPTERQIVLMVNNRLNGCSYCMSAHSAIAKMQGIADDVIDALRNGTPITDSKLEALRTFAVKVNESRGWLEPRDLDAVFAAGYSKRTVLEVVLGTAVKVMSNYTNHIVSTPLDEPFVATEWTPNDAVATSS